MQSGLLQLLGWKMVLWLLALSASGTALADDAAMPMSPHAIGTDEPVAESILPNSVRSVEPFHDADPTDTSDQKVPVSFNWHRLVPSPSARSDWEFSRDGFRFREIEVSARQGIYPVFGPPPPFITPSFTLSAFDAPDSVDVPEELYTLSVEFSWLRPINDQWALRLSLTPTFASDMRNTTSDAWRFRGMALAFYDWSREWKVGFGVVATGREDLPLIPGIGAVWTPTPETKVDLFFPRPRLSYRLLSDERRQTWAYLGGGLGGGTWAFERRDGMDDVLTYRSWQLLLGMEWTPPATDSSPWNRNGLRGFLEVGYVFGRRLEYEADLPDFHPGDSGLCSVGLSY